jgi:hypothetical protein
VKVITPGNARGQWAKKTICRYCDSVIEVAAEDIKARWDQAGWGGDPGNWEYYYICGFCHLKVHISYDFAPYEIIRNLQNESRK